MRRLVFFVGGAGAGKTTLAKRIARKHKAVLLDMDTLLRPAAVVVMTTAGLDPDDRDSEAYKTLCRDLGYRITMDAALENVELGNDVFVIGPFTKETGDAEWIERELTAIGATLRDVEVKAVIVTLADDEAYRNRIMQRSSRLDEWKLKNWEIFSRSLAPRSIAWKLPPTSVLTVDNSLPLTEEKLWDLEQFVYDEERAAVGRMHSEPSSTSAKAPADEG
ncbi:AAA family ATPase [Paenibacillus sp. GCM10012307]|uniref:AAA family ATPase n=1 Tax=Paenibacillus roseus TaxID=2798579 RepID=A0A934J067_9BACL|nr:AAA family ATPase [Paenibacillus roseus]MBJ6360300.1 AAA family ATPase [Paenibacillus roseus]